jgi:hypothetical protein
MRRMFALFLITAAAVCARAGEAPPPEPLAVAPEDAVAVLVVDDWSRTTESFKKTALYALLQTEDARAFIEPIAAEMDKELSSMAARAGLKKEVLTAALTGSVTASALGWDAEKRAPIVLLAARGADPQAAAAAYAALKELLPKEFIREQEHRGSPALIVGPEGAPTLGMAVHKGTLLLSNSAAAVTAAIDRLEGAGKSLAYNPRFALAARHLGDRRDLALFVNVDRLRETLAAASENFKPGAEGDRVLDALGIKDTHFVGAALAADGRGFRTRLVITSAKPDEGPLGVMGREDVDRTVLRAVPATARMASAQRLRPDKFAALARAGAVKAAGANAPPGPGPVDRFLAAVKETSKIDLETDVLANLEGSAALAVDASGAFFGLDGVMVILKVNDPAQAQALVEKTAAFAAGAVRHLGGRDLPLAPEVRKTTYRGVAVHYFTPRSLAIGPAFFARDDLLVVTSSLPQARRSIRTLIGEDKPSLADDKAFAKALADAALTPGSGVSFIRTSELASAIASAAGMAGLASDFAARFTPEKVGRWKGLLSSIDVSQFPDSGIIARHMFDTAGSTRAVEGGVLFESYGPLPVSVPGGGSGAGTIAALAVIAAVAIPELMEPKRPDKPSEEKKDADVRCVLTPDNAVFKDSRKAFIKARIENAGGKSVSLRKDIVDNPALCLRIYDEAGAEMPKNTPVVDPPNFEQALNLLRELKPGEKWEIEYNLDVTVEPLPPGKYTVAFEYGPPIPTVKITVTIEP